ncbi:hypothetical protein BRC81_02990 [Halobacteriales archaeon QS_1_68_20]|nr:MAG: hypothetical protein BRC81_02990 [Halobacteriales archaeon QS_1_68_20]
MTHTTTVEKRVSDGSYEAVFATLDITGLDNANNESFDPAAEFEFDEVLGVSVEGLENPDSYVVQWDHLENALYVEGYGGTDPTAGTAVGQVRVKASGDPSA